MKQTTLIILAGGIGKRMWPLTTNKVLFPFFGSPLFSYTIANLPRNITRIIIVTNPGNDAAIRSMHFPVPTSTVIQKEPRGMADAIVCCKSALLHEAVVIINVDDLIDPDLIKQVIKDDVFGVIPGKKTASHGPFGYLSIDQNRVTGITEKPKKGEEPSGYVNVVCHYISDVSAFIAEIEKTKSANDDVYEKALTSLVQQQYFEFLPYDGPMIALKYPWHVLDVMGSLFHDIVRHKGKNVIIKTGVTIEGEVYLDDNVKIFEHTKIIGPCYIGKNTIIGNNTIIRGSHIGADCVIGFNCDVTRSYIGDGCWLHSNYVGDSVLEKNVSMGGGAKLANLRLDERLIGQTGRNKFGSVIAADVRIGVNASIMPGVKIGTHVFIGAGVILQEDLKANTLCFMKSTLIIKSNKNNTLPSRESFKKNL